MTCEHHGNLVICRPSGSYLAQIRLLGHRKWKTVSEHHASPESAMGAAMDCMTREHKRARVLFIDDSGYYEPNLVMEARRL